MGEQILAAAVRGDETEALGIVEPLDCTCTHCIALNKKLKRVRDFKKREPSTGRYAGKQINGLGGSAKSLLENPAGAFVRANRLQVKRISDRLAHSPMPGPPAT
jgi:hypothetical protein